jgi:hypothetical protein
MAESAPLLPDDTAGPSALFGGSYAPKIDTAKLEKSTLQIDKSKLRTEQALLAGMGKDDANYKSLADRAYKAEAFDQNDPALKGWNADQERAKYSTDPLQAFGSFASVAGIIASAFVHAPIATALDASASAMNAIKEGDDKMFDAAHQAWKDNTELFLKRHELQHQAFTDALEMRDKNWTIGNQKFKEAALMFGDQQMLAMHEAGMFPEIETLMQHRQDAQLKLAQAYPKMEEDFVKMGQMFALGYDPKEPGSDKSIAAVKKWNDQYGPYAARSGRTPEESLAVESRAQEITDADPSIPSGKARMMAEAELSEAKGSAASTRADKAIASRQEIADARQAEIARHNEAVERLSAGKGDTADARQKEIERHNKALEDIGAGRLDETKAHNRATEEARKSASAGVPKTWAGAKAARLASLLEDGKLPYPEAIKQVNDEFTPAKAFTTPEETVLSTVPSFVRHLETLDYFAGLTGPVQGVPIDIAARYPGINDPGIVYQSALSEAKSLVSDIASSRRLSVLGLKAKLDTLPKDYESARFNRKLVQETLRDVIDQSKIELSTMEAGGKKIPPSVADAFNRSGIYPESMKNQDPVLKLQSGPESLSDDELSVMSSYGGALSGAQREILVNEIKRRMQGK